MTKGRFIGKFSDLGEPIGKVGSKKHEYVYNCPYCSSLRGKDDKEGKLYYNTLKGQGFCQKCNTPVFDDTALTIDKVYERHYKEDLEDPPVERLNLKHWTVPAKSDPIVYAYLQGRGFSDYQINKYNLRASNLPFKGVVIPNKIFIESQETDFLQIRRVDNQTKGTRYSTPSNVNKPLYAAHLVSKDTKTVIICEGCFSGIACDSLLDNSQPVATYGKYITASQLSVLKSLPVEDYILAYDGGEIAGFVINSKILVEAGLNPRLMLLPFQEDPNSIKKQHLKYLLENATVRINRTGLVLLREIASDKSFNIKSEAEWTDFSCKIQEIFSRRD